MAIDDAIHELRHFIGNMNVRSGVSIAYVDDVRKKVVTLTKACSQTVSQAVSHFVPSEATCEEMTI